MDVENGKRKNRTRKVRPGNGTQIETQPITVSHFGTRGTMWRKGDEGVRHTTFSVNYAMLLRTWGQALTPALPDWLWMEWKTQALISTSTVTVLADAEVPPGDKLSSDLTCGHLFPPACDWELHLPPREKAAEHGCLINTQLLDDWRHTHYSKSTRVPQIWMLKALFKGEET